jgi:hypothetical protein
VLRTIRFTSGRFKQKAFSGLRIALHIARNALAVVRGTQPGAIFFQQEIEWFFGVDEVWVQQAAAEYRAAPSVWKYLSGLRSPSRKTDGFAKTLDVAEGFALWCLVRHMRPKVVVELGTQYGLSARIWKEALKRYVPDHELFLCDLEDVRRFIGDDESTMLKGDARETIKEVYATRTVDILHNDAHPYDLIRWSVEEGLRQGVRLFTFHDVGRNHLRSTFRSEHFELSAQEKSNHDNEFSAYGHWERHVIAELFDQRALSENAVENDTCQIQFFDSLFGIGLVRVKRNPIVPVTETEPA